MTVSAAPSRLRAVRAIVGTELRRTARDKTGLFFVIVLPVVIIVIIGATFGANTGNLPIGLVDGDGSATATELVDALESSGNVTITRYDDRTAMNAEIRSGVLVGGVEIPAGFGDDLTGDRTATLVVFAEDPQNGQAAAEVVQASADELGTTYAARRFAAERTGASSAEVDAAVTEAVDRIPTIEVTATSVGEAPLEGTDNQFSYTAPSNLVFFVFINSLTIGAVLIETRRLGVARRMLAAPITVSTTLLGVGASRFAFALVQSAIIVAVGRVLFGVEWGQTVAVAAVVVAFSLVGAGAGLLVGSVARNVEQAQSVGIPVAIGLAMLGGCMWPLDVVSEPLQVIGHLTPHAWAMDAWIALIFEGEAITAIWLDLVVLFAYAAVLLAVATYALRRRLLSGT